MYIAAGAVSPFCLANGPMKILIADEIPDVGKRLERLLRRLPGVMTVNYCSSADDAILRLMELQPDLLILEHKLDRVSAGSVRRKIPHYSPHTEVFVYAALLSEIDRSVYDMKQIRIFSENSGGLDTLLAHVEFRADRMQEKKLHTYVPIN